MLQERLDLVSKGVVFAANSFEHMASLDVRNSFASPNTVLISVHYYMSTVDSSSSLCKRRREQ